MNGNNNGPAAVLDTCLICAAFACLLIAGCGENKTKFLSRVNINGVEIQAASTNRPDQRFDGEWRQVRYIVHVSKSKIGMAGILQTVRVTWPDREYYTAKPASWPPDVAVQGVLRGPEEGGQQATIALESSAGLVEILFLAQTDCINPDFVASFFENTTITNDSYHFPDDNAGDESSSGS